MTNTPMLAVAGCIAFSLAASATAYADSAWRIRHGNGQMWAEASSLAHGSTITVHCDEDNTSLVLTVRPPASWNGAAGYKMKVLIDSDAFAVVADGTDDGVVLSNLPHDKVGIDTRLVGAMKGGRELRLDGPPATAVQAKQKTFSLNGAKAAITRIENACPSK